MQLCEGSSVNYNISLQHATMTLILGVLGEYSNGLTSRLFAVLWAICLDTERGGMMWGQHINLLCALDRPEL